MGKNRITRSCRYSACGWFGSLNGEREDEFQVVAGLAEAGSAKGPSFS